MPFLYSKAKFSQWPIFFLEKVTPCLVSQQLLCYSNLAIQPDLAKCISDPEHIHVVKHSAYTILPGSSSAATLEVRLPL